MIENQRSQTVAIQIKEVSKIFGEGDQEVHAVENLSLDIYQNELLLIMGPSGSGKTTLLSLLGGTLYCEKGSLVVFGKELEKCSHEELTDYRKNFVGFIFQQFHLVPTLTAKENVAVPLFIHGYDKEKAFEEAAERLESLGLHHMAERFPKELSGGEMQRVAIARALVHKPRLVICDEPTSNLDSHTGEKIMEILKRISREDECCVVVVTHDPRIVSWADRIASMSDGKIVDIKVCS